MLKLREDKRTGQGRAKLRERVEVEHALARVGAIQGNRARYKGARKNTMDARRTGVIANLQALQRHGRLPKGAAACAHGFLR